jgi:peptide-methionine (R)-S-oxide reductase
MIEKIRKTEEEWKKILSPEQFEVMREKSTERPFSCSWLDRKVPGIYHCAACDLPLFDARMKFDSGTGWPSYFEPVDSENIEYRDDSSHGMIRTEVLCVRCESHLGHVFQDDSSSDKKRYCINAIALCFKPEN